MEITKLIADLVSAVAAIAVAVAAWIQLPLISAQVRGLAEQIRLSREADVHARQRAKEWETIKICERYNFDPVIEAATQRSWAASDGGRDYRKPGVDQRDLIIVLNYLDGVATGVRQELYIEGLVKDHIGFLFDDSVTKYIESGVIDKKGFEAALALHAHWFRAGPPVAYRASS
jgi:hypothetical protein